MPLSSVAHASLHADKSHGLGNDYLVADPADLPFDVTPSACDCCATGTSASARTGCSCSTARCGVRIFNPDGSEAEKSGNGLRIFAKWLFDTGRGATRHLRHRTLGGDAPVEVDDATVVHR